jgi:RNA polymerase sigma-70 factor (ECF subfamily)
VTGRRRLDDRSLVEGLLKGDPAAQSYLDREYRPRLYKACCYILGYRDGEAEDVVQDAFIAAYDHLATFEFRSSLYTWLHRICVHRCFEVVRKRRRQVATEDATLELMSGKAAQERMDREQEARRHEIALRVLRETQEVMGEPCKSLLTLRDTEGKSYAALAEILRVPIGTVMSRLSRCKETLAKMVRERLERENHG